MFSFEEDTYFCHMEVFVNEFFIKTGYLFFGLLSGGLIQ